MKAGLTTQPPVAQTTTHRYNTRYQERRVKQQAPKAEDTVAKASDRAEVAHLTGGRPPARPNSPASGSSSSSDSSSGSSSSSTTSGSSVDTSSETREAKQVARLNVTLARSGSTGIKDALEQANLRSPSGPRYKMGGFDVGSNVKSLFDTFSGNCVASNDRFHTSVKDGTLPPQGWAQYLTNMQAIMLAARANAGRETGNVSGSYDGRLNQAAHAGRDLAKLKEAGVSAPKSPTAGVAALVEHMHQNPKFGDVDAFLFYGMSLVFGGAMQRNIGEINTDSWNLDYNPTIYQYGDDANKLKTGSQYFATLERALKGRSADELSELKGHITTSFKLYTATLNEIVPNSADGAAAGGSNRGVLSSLANLAGRLAFWR